MSHYLSGLPAWLVQRLGAIYLALFSVGSVIYGYLSPPLDYAAWRALFSAPLSGTAIAMAFLALLLHSWVGMRDVILDYAGRNPWLRLLLLSLLGGALIAMAVWMVHILVGVMR
jgi:succinate dehydrogenase / fumarate reductase membrane anchor subunit